MSDDTIKLDETIVDAAKDMEINLDELSDEERNLLTEAAEQDASVTGETDTSTLLAEKDKDTSTETDKTDEPLSWESFKDEKNPNYKVLSGALEFIKAGDPRNDTNHPFHDVVRDNHVAAQKALNERADSVKDLENSRNEFNELKQSYDDLNVRFAEAQSAGGTTYAGMTLEDARDQGKEGVWFTARDKSLREQTTQDILSKIDAREHNQAITNERVNFIKAHPEVDIKSFEDKYSSISYEQGYTLQRLETDGGMDTLLKTAREEGAKQATKTLLEKIKINSSKKSLTGQPGTSLTSDFTAFAMPSEDELMAMSESERLAFGLRMKEAFDAGSVPKELVAEYGWVFKDTG